MNIQKERKEEEKPSEKKEIKIFGDITTILSGCTTNFCRLLLLLLSVTGKSKKQPINNKFRISY